MTRNVVELGSLQPNKVKLNTHNSKTHELIKCSICYDLQKAGKTYITEAKFTENRGIADVFIPKEDKATEVLVSETVKQYLEKIRKYPCAFIDKVVAEEKRVWSCNCGAVCQNPKELCNVVTRLAQGCRRFLLIPLDLEEKSE